MFIGLNPKNWEETKTNLKEKAEELVSEDESNVAPDEIWSFTNDIDASRNPETRAEMITRRGLDNFEIDLEMISLKHEYAYIQKQEIDKILPYLKALSIHLANQGIILNDNFEADLEYIQNFIKGKIQNKTVDDIKALGNMKDVVDDLMKKTSILALA